MYRLSLRTIHVKHVIALVYLSKYHPASWRTTLAANSNTFPPLMGVLTSAYYLGGKVLAKTGSDQLLVHMTKRNSVACHITSDLDFDKEDCVIHKTASLMVPGHSMI